MIQSLLILFVIFKVIYLLLTNTFIFGILSTIIGAYLSYIIYRVKTIHNLNKYLINIIKSDFKNNYERIDVYSIHKLTELNDMIQSFINICDDVNKDIFKLNGKENKIGMDIKYKLDFIKSELSRINFFILEISKTNNGDFNEHNYIIYEKLLIFDGIFDDIRNIGFSDNNIQKQYEWFCEHGIRIKPTVHFNNYKLIN